HRLSLPGWPLPKVLRLAAVQDAFALPDCSGRRPRAKPPAPCTGSIPYWYRGCTAGDPGRKMMVRTGPAAFLAALLFLTTVRPLGAQLPAGPGDWPGWRGPDRTDLSTETGLLKQWPAEGPKLLWKATGLGAGFSTPSVAGSKIYLVGTKGKDEYLFALDATDGRQLWATRVGTMTGGHPGPRSTPTVD